VNCAPCRAVPRCGIRAIPPGLPDQSSYFRLTEYNRDRIAAEGWALHTWDGSRAAHLEHTVAITDGGPRILTLP